MCMTRIFVALLCLLSIAGCRGHIENQVEESIKDETLNMYLDYIQDCFSRQDYDAALAKSYELRNLGEREGKRKYVLYADIYKAQCFMTTNVVDSMYYYFESTLAMASEDKDLWALATIYNAMGGNAAFGEGDYTRGITYLTKGIEYASGIRDTSRMMLLETNLAMLYYVINDSTGLRYALDVYRMGLERGDDYNIFLGALISANMYWMMNDAAMARQYAEKAMPLVEQFDLSRETYVLYADILRGAGEEEKAVMYYEKAFREKSGPGLFSFAGLYVGYTEYLKEHGQYGKAIDVLMEGLHTLDTTRSPVNRQLVYHSLSEIYEDISDYRKALFYYKLYNEESNRQLSLETDREIKAVQMQYEKQKHEMELLGWRNRYNVAVMAFALAVCVLAGLYILYYNKRKNYRQLLKQHQAILERQDKMHVRQVGMPQDKMKEMFDRLERLMREKELFRQSDLSRDKVAQMLATNRTYLCSVIKQFTGMSFTYYVNSFRINEAVRILSDPNDDTPVKAVAGNLGYSSLTTFYRLFEAAKGMPPSKYRETVVQNAKLADWKK